MRDFLLEVRREYATMTPADWAQWITIMSLTALLMIYMLSKA